MKLCATIIAVGLTAVCSDVADARFFQDNLANDAFVQLRCQVMAAHKEDWDAVLRHAKAAKASLQEYSVQRLKKDQSDIQPIYPQIAHAVKFGEPDFTRGRLYEIAYQEIERLIVDKQKERTGMSRKEAESLLYIFSLCDH